MTTLVSVSFTDRIHSNPMSQSLVTWHAPCQVPEKRIESSPAPQGTPPLHETAELVVKQSNEAFNLEILQRHLDFSRARNPPESGHDINDRSTTLLGQVR